MHRQTKIHILPDLSDDRKITTGINPLLKKFAEKTTTVKFQIILMLILALVDYLMLLANGVTDKQGQFLVFLAIDSASFFMYVHLIFPKISSSTYNTLTTPNSGSSATISGTTRCSNLFLKSALNLSRSSKTGSGTNSCIKLMSSGKS